MRYAIKYNGIWRIAVKTPTGASWYDVDEDVFICAVGDEDRAVELD